MKDDLFFVLQRYSDDGQSTLGLLLERRDLPRLDFLAYTLEDEHRERKVGGETRIWSGQYALGLREEPTPKTAQYRARFSWFTWHIEILNVPGFTRVYLHLGNDEHDTDACILVGDGANNNQVAAGRTFPSTPAFERFYRRVMPHLAAGGRAFIDIRNESRLW